MSRFLNLEDALKHMEEPSINEDAKWQALAVVLRELLEGYGFDTEHQLNSDKD